MANHGSTPKTLVFSFDGTGNEPGDAGGFKEDESISNILKLHVLMGGGVEGDRSRTTTPHGAEQKTYYYNGIGTRGSGSGVPVLGRLFSAGSRIVNMTVAPSFGDARRILNEARADFREADYKRGDGLVMFGFSRGAALARKFASLVLAEQADCRVSFLGVFDTVAAMNGVHRRGESISSDVVFENGTLNERIERAVHLVSIDEDRVAFTPTLINKDDANPGRILEAWFPGVHSDIGGGYWFDGLSDVALEFMIEQCKGTLGDDISIRDGDPDSISALIREQGSALQGLESDDIAINPMVGGVVHKHTGVGAAMYPQDPRSVHVCDNDRPCTGQDHLPLLHHSVKERFEKVADYRPPALRGLAFRLLLPDGTISEPIHGISGLREHALPS